MKQLKILFITKKMQFHIEKSTYYLARELERQCDLTLWHEDGNLPDVVSSMHVKPDFILFNDLKPDYCPFMRNIDQVNLPKGALVHDLHYRIPRRKKLYQKGQIDHLFVQYRDAFLNWYPEFQDQMIWLPHHVPEHLFKDYQLPKETDLLMLGSLIPHLYPLRVKMYECLQRFPSFMYYDHPGYKNIPESKNTYVTGIDYAKILNKSKVFLTCDSIYHFPVLKYYEALACRTLLLASGSQELRDLGFINEKTFVEVDESNFHQKAMYYLQNERERDRIATEGLKLIQQRHTTKIRVKELIEHIQRILN